MNLQGNLKLEIISGKTPKRTMNCINDWLKNNPVEIKEIKYITGTELLFIMILYNEKAKCKIE